jgi:hypothetical protein
LDVFSSNESISDKSPLATTAIKTLASVVPALSSNILKIVFASSYNASMPVGLPTPPDLKFNFTSWWRIKREKDFKIWSLDEDIVEFNV